MRRFDPGIETLHHESFVPIVNFARAKFAIHFSDRFVETALWRDSLPLRNCCAFRNANFLAHHAAPTRPNIFRLTAAHPRAAVREF